MRKFLVISMAMLICFSALRSFSASRPKPPVNVIKSLIKSDLYQRRIGGTFDRNANRYKFSPPLSGGGSCYSANVKSISNVAFTGYNQGFGAWIIRYSVTGICSAGDLNHDFSGTDIIYIGKNDFGEWRYWD